MMYFLLFVQGLVLQVSVLSFALIFGNILQLCYMAACPSDYPQEYQSFCYERCENKNNWTKVYQDRDQCFGCPSSHPSKEATLCYKDCPRNKPHKAAYNCFGNCPSGYRNDGLTCFRDAHIIASDNRRCPWYDKCGLTFRRGCSRCRNGYINDGCTCRRDAHAISRPSYNRGVGVALKSYGRGHGRALLLFPTYEARYDKPACSIGNWQASSFVDSSTEVMKFVNNNQRVIVFGFRGTEATNIEDWLKNLDFHPSSTTVGGRTFTLHGGFKDRYNNIARWFEKEYKTAISSGNKIILTGHSLGGAEAVIAAVYAAAKLNRAPDAVVTYGAPLTGNQNFVNYYKNVVGCGRTLRFTAKGDKVPGIPNVYGYTHACSATEVDGGGSFLQAHDLYFGYQKGLEKKYGNGNSISAGCDTSF